MKVYVVTNGYYSDYDIEKIFTNRAAAEEYKKYHKISNEIEEYEIYDEPFGPDDGEKAMFIRVQGTMYPEDIVNIRFEITPELIHNWTMTRSAGIWPHGKDAYTIYKYMHVLADNWDEEKYKAKMTKALYDLAGVAKSMFAEGASLRDVEQALREVEDER